jgi:hypothetical protein
VRLEARTGLECDFERRRPPAIPLDKEPLGILIKEIVVIG